MGGSVGLKGTDGQEILHKAIELGAKPNALNRTRAVLKGLESIKSRIKFISCPNSMGELVLKEFNFDYEIISHPIFRDFSEPFGTSAEHTIEAAILMSKIENLKLIIFVGGDGTARDLIKAVNKNKPCLGIPAGGRTLMRE